MVRARCSPREQRCPVTGLRTLMVRARCSPREQGAHPGSKVPGYRSSDPNGESKVLTPGARCPVTGLRTLMSKVLTPGARCPVTGLRTLMVRARCSPREQGARLPVFGPQLIPRRKTKNAKVKINSHDKTERLFNRLEAVKIVRCPAQRGRALVSVRLKLSPPSSVARPRAQRRPQLRRRSSSRCDLRRWSSGNLNNRDRQVTPLRDLGERGRTRIGHFLRENGQDIRKVSLVHRYLQGGPDVVLHRFSPTVKGPSAKLIHQVLPDRSSRDCCENGFSGLLTSADVTGEQDGIGQDFLPQIRAFQDPSPGLLSRLELALELLDPLVPLGEGLFEGRHFSTVDFVPIFSPGEEISDRVSHLHNYRSTAEVDKKKSTSCGRLIPVLHQHVDHRSRRPGPVAARAFRRCDLLDLGLFFLPALGSPGLAMIATQAGGMRGGQGQPGRDQGFGAGVRCFRGLGLLGPEANFLRRGWWTGGDREAPHSA
nr:hypothetical protein Iba_chr07dCG6170 [Ipomoea batatas]